MSEHTNARIRAWLAECGPASCGDYSRAHGLTGKASHQIGQRMAGMAKEGVLSRIGKGGPGSPFVYQVAREAMDRKASAAAAAEGRRKAAEQRRATLGYAPKRTPAPRPRKATRVAAPKVTARPAPKPCRRIKEDGAFTPSALTAPPVDKAALPDTEAFLRANPSALIRLAPGVVSEKVDRLTPAQRRSILTLEVAA